MTRQGLLLSAALGLCLAAEAQAQETADPREAPARQDSLPGAGQDVPTPAPAGRADVQPRLAPDGTPSLQTPAIEVPPPSATPLPADDDQIQFDAKEITYDYEADIVTASGDVRLFRRSDRLRADKVTWNRKTGQVMADGNVIVVNPEGDAAYGDHVELTDTLKDGVVQNMLVVLDAGGRIAAERGTRANGVYTVENAAYTPCSVTSSAGCPKEPSWKITARHVVYNPDTKRIRYNGARISVFNLVTLPLPVFSHPIGGQSDDGFLAPDVRYNRTNGLQLALPYFFSLAPNRDLTVTPRIYSDTLPMLQGEYRALTSKGAYRVTAYGTYSRRADDLTVTPTPATESNDFRGYLDAVANFQLDPNWSAGTSIRVTSDRTFLRRYDISRDDRLRNNAYVQRIDENSYFAVNAWAVQTLRVGERQGLQPIALPEIDYRRRFDDGLVGGKFEVQLNTLAIARTGGQDTQRAFASARWDLRRITDWGQEVTLTAYGRADAYNTSDTLATSVVSYRGENGFQFRGIGAAAVDVKWPFIGEMFGGTQRITPRVQLVASPSIKNMAIPNEDARAVDLEDSNLFALNRFPGYDRFEDGSRFTWGLDYGLYLPGLSIDANVGQSYRLNGASMLFPDGTGLNGRVSDIVGRTVVRFRDFLSFTHRYRLDKNNFAVRRNEIDTTLGSRNTYFQVGYLRLNRDINGTLEDLQDREEARVGGRVQIDRFWSVSGSILVDLTDRQEDSFSLADGFEPVRHRLGVSYEDDCLRLGVTWRRDYQTTGDARRGNSFLFSMAFKNLGR